MSKLERLPGYEANPFPAQLPPPIAELGPEVGSFLQEVVSTLREQHSATQSGDTTVPWEELTEVSSSKQFSVGSEGRFLHPIYGVIAARYVEFTGAGVVSNEFDYALIAGFDHTETPHQWAVSTKFADSAAADAVGWVASYTRPTEGKFGWLITRGVNLHSVHVKADVLPAIGTRLVWEDDSSVSPKDVGAIVGVVASVTGARKYSDYWELPPASIRVEVHQQPIVTSVQDLSAKVDAIQVITNTASVMTSPNLIGAWVASGSPYAPIGYSKGANGLVTISGSISAPLGSPMAAPVFVLPEGFRPSTIRSFVGSGKNGLFTIIVDSSGRVAVEGASPAYSDFGFIQFFAG